MFDFKRPRITIDGDNLFYLSRYDGSNPRFRLAAPQNILIQLKLYRWCMSDEYHSPVVKPKLVRSLFGHIAPDISTNAVGRVMAKLVTYNTHKQVNENRDGFITPRMHWRFYHQLDMRFGLEYLIYLWLPRLTSLDGGSIETWEEFEDELEIILSATDDELSDNYVRPAIRYQTKLYHL